MISFSLHHFLLYLLYFFTYFHSFTPFFLYFIKPGISVDRKGRISLHKETCFYHGTTINSLILVLLHVPIGGFTLNLKTFLCNSFPIPHAAESFVFTRSKHRQHLYRLTTGTTLRRRTKMSTRLKKEGTIQKTSQLKDKKKFKKILNRMKYIKTNYFLYFLEKWYQWRKSSNLHFWSSDLFFFY